MIGGVFVLCDIPNISFPIPQNYPSIFFRTAIIPLKISFIYSKKAIHQKMHGILSWRRPIFPGSFPPSIFGTAELNFCVRDGNRWDLSVINTSHIGDPCGNRTRVTGVRGRCLNRLTNGPSPASPQKVPLPPVRSFQPLPAGTSIASAPKAQHLLVRHQGLEPGTR